MIYFNYLKIVLLVLIFFECDIEMYLNLDLKRYKNCNGYVNYFVYYVFLCKCRIYGLLILVIVDGIRSRYLI